MTETIAFWNNIAPGYARQPIKDQARYEATLARARAHLKPSDHVLEIGCGTGTTALLLAPSVAKLHATDISPAMIEIAQAKLENERLEGISFAAGKVEDIAVPGVGYDAVLAFNILHLVGDLPATLKAVHARLKPGGIMVSKTGCLCGVFRLF